MDRKLLNSLKSVMLMTYVHWRKPVKISGWAIRIFRFSKFSGFCSDFWKKFPPILLFDTKSITYNQLSFFKIWNPSFASAALDFSLLVLLNDYNEFDSLCKCFPERFLALNLEEISYFVRIIFIYGSLYVPFISHLRLNCSKKNWSF